MQKLLKSVRIYDYKCTATFFMNHSVYVTVWFKLTYKETVIQMCHPVPKAQVSPFHMIEQCCNICNISNVHKRNLVVTGLTFFFDMKYVY